MTYPITELVPRVQAHDKGALADFLELRRGQLTAFIQRQLGTELCCQGASENIFREVSAEAMRAIDQTDLTGRDPFDWLCRIAERKIIDLHRQHFAAQKREIPSEAPPAAPASDESRRGLLERLVASLASRSAPSSRNIREARLQEALAGLSAELREALRMRYVENRSSREIAQRLGKSTAAVRVMLSRGLRRLQHIDQAQSPSG